MAVTFMTGFEAQNASIDGITITGTAAYSATARTGGSSIYCSPASGSSGYITLSTASNYQHFGLRASGALGERLVFGSIAAGTINLRLTGTLEIKVYLNTTLIGTSASLNNSTWYWIGVRQVTGTNVAFLQIDGTDSVTGTATVTATSAILGYSGTESYAGGARFDDVIGDNTNFLAPSKVTNLVPISDNANTNWVRGGGSTTTSLYIPVSTAPPPGVASASETDSTNIECASNTTNNYTANLTTYATAGIKLSDTLLAVYPVIRHGEDISTNTKAGTVEIVANPAISTTSFNFGNDAGAHAAESSSPLWYTTFGTLTTSPSVTLSSSPTMRVIKTTTSTRVACVDYMGMIVAWEQTGYKVYAQAQVQLGWIGQKSYGQAQARIKQTYPLVGISGFTRGTQFISDDFSGTSGTTWPNADTGGAYGSNVWWELNPSYSETGGVGIINSYTNDAHSGWRLLNSPTSRSDIEVQVLVDLIGVSSTGGCYAGIGYRFVDFTANGYYIIALRPISSTSVNIELHKNYYSANNISDSTRVAYYTKTVATFASSFYIHLFVVGNHHVARFWKSSDSEPQTWDIDTTDSTYSAAGKVGVLDQLDLDTSTTFDDFAAYEATEGSGTIGPTYAQAQATISASSSTTYKSYGQSQAKIKGIAIKGYAQSLAQIKVLANKSYAQALATITVAGGATTYKSYAQAQVRVAPIATNAYETEILADSPSFLFPMDESSGNIIDIIGSKVGSVSGSPTYGVTGPIAGLTAIDFSATTQYFTVTDHDDLDIDLSVHGYTLEVWHARDTDSAGWEVFGWKGTNGWEFGIDTNDHFFTGQGNVGMVANASSSVTPADGSWHYYVASIKQNAGTLTATDVDLYIDGQLVSKTFYTSYKPVPTASDAVIGAETTGGTKGKLAYVALYKTVLSSTRIAAHFNAGKTKQYAQAQTTIIVAGATTSRSYAQAQVRIAYIGYEEVLAKDGAVFVLPMDESSGNITDIIGGKVGTAAGTPVYNVAGPIRGHSAININGASDFSFTDHADLDLGNGPFTIEFWIKRNDITSGTYIIGKTDATLATPGYAIELRNGTPDTVRLQNGATSSHVNNTADLFADTNWHHVVFSRPLATTATMYVDGSSVSVSSSAITFSDNNLALVVGGLYSENSRFAGSISYLAIYKSALTAGDVYRHYRVGLNTYYENMLIADGANVIFPLDEPSGNIVDIISGYVGAVSGSPSYSQSGPIISRTAIDFPAGTAYFTVTDPGTGSAFDLGTGNFTVEYWFARDEDLSPLVSVALYKGAGTFNFGITDGAKRMFGYAGTGSFANGSVNVAVDSIWHHVVWTRTSGGTNTLYVDGISETLGYTNDTYTAVDTNDPFIIGRENSTERAAGKLAYVAIYKSVLTSTQIAAHYAARKALQIYAQAQTTITASSIITYVVYGQSQTHIKFLADKEYAQTQAQIKTTYRGYAQANTWIETTYRGYGQTQAQIEASYLVYGQAQAKIKGIAVNGYGQSQAQIKTTYLVYGQAQSQIKTTYQVWAQANTYIKTPNLRVYAQSQAQIKQSYQVYGQAQAQIKQAYKVYGQANTWIEQTTLGYAQALARIKQVYQVYGQSQTQIEQSYQGYAQAQGKIILSGRQSYGQTQAQIEQTYQVYAQAQARVKQTYSAYAQANARIIQTYQGYGQAQAKLRAFNVQVYGQSNAWIKNTGLLVYSQALAQIKTYYQVMAQAQGQIKQTYRAYAQSQAHIKTTYQSYGQSQTKLNAFGVQGYAQASVWMEGAFTQFAQSQAKLNAFAVKSYGQVQAWIETTYATYSQVQAQIKASYLSYAQSQVQIKTTYQVYGQSQAQIKQTYRGYAQANTYIKITGIVAFAQAQADIKATYVFYGQAQAWIKNTYRGYAQAQSHIVVRDIRVYAQAGATIRAYSYMYAQALVWIYIPQIARPIADISNDGNWVGTIKN
jgi:hypothetical protein